MTIKTRLSCVLCDEWYPITEERLYCGVCRGLLEVTHDLDALSRLGASYWTSWFRSRSRSDAAPDKSGVWRYRDFVLPEMPVTQIVSRGEGNTRMYRFEKTNRWLGKDNVLFKHEGENPTGSFKDRGVTVAMSWAKLRGAKAVLCASTGNTAASVASYASLAGIPAVVVIPENATALGKVSQAIAYGAAVVKVRGGFDSAMRLVSEAQQKLGIPLMNSVNPFRIEGQKTIIFEALEELYWNAPDWIVVPGGNLGNTSAFGKALLEAKEIGLIKRLPRIAVIQAAGANPFYRSWQLVWEKVVIPEDKVSTIATAIKIGDPQNFDKAVAAVSATGGVVCEVSDDEIMDAKAVLDSDGVGAEPASCATAAGIRKLTVAGAVRKDERVLAVLTGHMLKDPDATVGYHTGALARISAPKANRPVVIDASLSALEDLLKRL